MTTADLTLLIKAKNEASAALNAVGRDAQSLGSKLGGALKAGGLLAAGGIGAAAVASVKFVGAASSLNESLSKVNVVFGDQSKEIEAWASKSAIAFGQSKQQALEAAGTYGNLFQAFGVGRDESAKMSTSLTKLAADLASFNNTSVDDALVALRSGLSGETEPLKRFGVAINDARLKDEALRLGLIKTTKDALGPAAKAQAAYALIMKDTALAQGDFERTSDGLANQQRILSAQWKDIQATIGNALLPTLAALAVVLTGFLAAHQADIDRFAQAFAETIPQAINAIRNAFEQVRPTLTYVFQQMRDGFDVIKPGLEWIINNKAALVATFVAVGAAALLAFTPVTLPILAVVAAIGAVLFILGTSKEEWRAYGEALNEIWENIQRVIEEKLGIIGTVIVYAMDSIRLQVETAFKIIRDVVTIVMALLQGDWSAAWNGIKQLGSTILDAIVQDLKLKLGLLRDVFGFAMMAAQAAVLTVWEEMKAWFLGLPGAIREAVGDVSGMMFEVGKQVLQGLIFGMLSQVKNLTDTSTGIVSIIPFQFSRVLLTHSPSRVMHEIGVNAMEGFRQGLEAGANGMLAALDNIIASIQAKVAQIQQKVAQAQASAETGSAAEVGERTMGSRDRPVRVGGRTRDEWIYIFGASGIPRSEYMRTIREMFGYERGSLFVPRTAPAMLHRGEAVMPAEMASMLRELLGTFKGGGEGAGMKNYGTVQIVLPNARQPQDFARELDRYFRGVA